MVSRQIWIVDFGSQYTQLITRKTRELGHSSEIMTVNQAKERFKNGLKPGALVLSGGPDSVSEDKENYHEFFNQENLAVLGICYGMQIMAREFGGKVEKGLLGEYGHTKIHATNGFNIPGVKGYLEVWMSHFDTVSEAPKGFKRAMESHNKILAAMVHETQPIMGLQFHPEVDHSEGGKEILAYFYEKLAGLEKDWDESEMLKEATALVQSIGDGNVLCAFSGGVDSLVAATLAHKVLGDKLHCFFVDNGLLRPQDHGHIKTLQEHTDLNITVLDSKEVFYKKLHGVDEPEKKRKAIGVTFIEVFEEQVHAYEKDRGIHFTHLLQGTLYPDVIESISPHEKDGKSVTIKSHHNVGGLPERMKLKLLEPLRFLFKDEVRRLGEELGLKYEWVHRHPFPGPGIGVRILGEVTPERVLKVQSSDQILFEELHRQNFYEATWQAFTVLLPVKTVGVKGDARAYEEVICVRMVNSGDGMTATWTDAPRELLSTVSSRICNEVKGVTRVVYDITSKPPGTIEWE